MNAQGMLFRTDRATCDHDLHSAAQVFDSHYEETLEAFLARMEQRMPAASFEVRTSREGRPYVMASWQTVDARPWCSKCGRAA